TSDEPKNRCRVPGVRCQGGACRGPAATEHRQRTTDNGQRTTDNGQLTYDSYSSLVTCHSSLHLRCHVATNPMRLKRGSSTGISLSRDEASSAPPDLGQAATTSL